jgi:hypothetical protein
LDINTQRQGSGNDEVYLENNLCELEEDLEDMRYVESLN